MQPSASTQPAEASQTRATQPTTSTESTVTISDRPVAVFRPPSSAGPAPISHDDADYVPTVEHAQIHQTRLQQESRNKRLPTDAELLAKQKEQREELQKIESVEIKVRLPDQSAISSHFGQADTATTLYAFVRECLGTQLKHQPFVLRNPGVRDKAGGAIANDEKRLILDLQLKGRVLVVFGWDDGASATARATKQVLKSELSENAREYVVPQIQNVGGEEDKGVKVELGPKTEGNEEGTVKSKVPKWLKGLARK